MTPIERMNARTRAMRDKRIEDVLTTLAQDGVRVAVELHETAQKGAPVVVKFRDEIRMISAPVETIAERGADGLITRSITRPISEPISE